MNVQSQRFAKGRENVTPLTISDCASVTKTLCLHPVTRDLSPQPTQRRALDVLGIRGVALCV